MTTMLERTEKMPIATESSIAQHCSSYTVVSFLLDTSKRSFLGFSFVTVVFVHQLRES